MFWDSSAIVPLLLRESHSDLLSAAFDGDTEPAVWWATPVESHAAVARAAREKQLTRADVVQASERLRAIRVDVDEIAPAEDVRVRALRLLSVHPLRAADALQLAAALFWAEEQPGTDTFVCLDRRLRDAARREGFALLPAE
jgi:predicted nucleic acid-binding protein